jgi:hypothetical protein
MAIRRKVIPLETHEAVHHDFVKTAAGMRIVHRESRRTVADCQGHAAATWLVAVAARNTRAWSQLSLRGGEKKLQLHVQATGASP